MFFPFSLNINPRFYGLISFLCFIFLSSSSFAQNVGIRAGIGQFASQAEQIDGKTGNSFLLASHIVPKNSDFRFDLSVRYNGVSESQVQIPTLAEALFEVKNVSQKIGYLGVCFGPGINIDMSRVGSGFGAWASVSGGVSFATVVTKIEYSDDATTPTYSYVNQKDSNNWKFFWVVGAGIKVQIFYIGVFLEADYYDGEKLEYNPVKAHTIAGDVELTEGGTIEPKGFAAYIGLSWN